MKRIFYLSAPALAGFLLIIYLAQGNTMGFLDFARIYIFSEVDGVVSMKGKPVSGAKVVRTADYRDKHYTHAAVTDGEGRFHFDDIYVYSMRLSETAILQKIMIHYQDREYLAWELMKRNDNRYGELNDPNTPDFSIKKLELRCELTENQDSEQTIGSELRRRIIYGLSRWN